MNASLQQLLAKSTMMTAFRNITRGGRQLTTLKDNQKIKYMNWGVEFYELLQRHVPYNKKKSMAQFLGFWADVVAQDVSSNHMQDVVSIAPTNTGECDFENSYSGQAAYYYHNTLGRIHRDLVNISEYPENPDFKHQRTGTCVAVIRENRGLLLVQRKGSHGAGQWALPGGHQEKGESLERCAARELMEEMSLECKDVRHSAITYDNFLTEDKGPKDYNTHWMVVLEKNPTAVPVIPERERAKMAEWRWVPLDEMLREVREQPDKFFYCIRQLLDQNPDIIKQWITIQYEMAYRHR